MLNATTTGKVLVSGPVKIFANKTHSKQRLAVRIVTAVMPGRISGNDIDQIANEYSHPPEAPLSR